MSEYRLFFEAKDYQYVKDISLKGYSKDGGEFQKGMPTFNGTKKLSAEEIKNDILINLLEAIDERIENKAIFIGRSECRKNEKISVFFDKDEQHSSESRINGIVGRVLLTLNNERILKKVHKADCLIVDITFQSRLDSARKSFFAAELLTYGQIDPLEGIDVGCDNESLFDFLLADLLVKSLDNALVKGVYKTYRTFYNNDDKLRGSVDVSRHVKLNAGMQNGKIAYSYRERTLNNYLNILLLKAYQHLKRKYPSFVDRKINSNRGVASYFDQLQYETDVGTTSVSTAIKENMNPIAHPYYNDYEEVRKVCLSILRNEGVSIFDKDDGSVNSFLYYVPDLYEDYLQSVFESSPALRDGSVSVSNQMDDVSFIQGCENDNSFIIPIRPDFIFYDGKVKNSKLILDAKLIPGWEGFALHDKWEGAKKEPGKTIKSNIDECLRYMEVFDTKSTGVVFPVSKRVSRENFYIELDELYSKYEYSVIRSLSVYSKKTFCIMPLYVPNAECFSSFGEWKRAFNASQELFVSRLFDPTIEIICK